MDYAKSGSSGAAKRAPAAKRHTTKGAPDRPKPDAKAELLARMKAAAEAKKG
jgi:hypothetical protein